MHVLPVGFVKIRHFGFFANANRRTSLALCRSLIATVAQNVPQVLSAAQTRAVDRICPFCHNGTLRVILRINARVLMQLPNRVLVNTS
jgi:hypothetical protein